MQRAMATRASEGSWPIRVRIGLHAGEVVRSGVGDVYGAHVNIAARVAAQAVGGQILISGEMADMIRHETAAAISPPRELELKGFPGTHQVHAVDWR
jgi:class 3 adenylate cyclase